MSPRADERHTLINSQTPVVMHSAVYMHTVDSAQVRSGCILMQPPHAPVYWTLHFSQPQNAWLLMSSSVPTALLGLCSQSDPALALTLLGMSCVMDAQHLHSRAEAAIGSLERFLHAVEMPSDRLTLTVHDRQGVPLVAMYQHARAALGLPPLMLVADQGADLFPTDPPVALHHYGELPGGTPAPSHAPHTPPAQEAPARQELPITWDLDALLGQLGQMVGLDGAKRQLRRYAALALMRRLRADAGSPLPDASLHMAFLGNPGTGKTSVARIVARMLFELGLVREDKLHELQCSDLVGKWIGHTEHITRAAIEAARGGVLFVDEAYSLAQSDSGNDFGRKALTEIVAGMENYRDDLVVIFAGYSAETRRMIDSNPGLKSRLAAVVDFEDYTPDQLALIGAGMIDGAGYQANEMVHGRLGELCEIMHASRDEHFGNARTVRSMIETAVMLHAERTIDQAHADETEPTVEMLTRLAPQDLEYDAPKPKRQLGFAS